MSDLYIVNNSCIIVATTYKGGYFKIWDHYVAFIFLNKNLPEIILYAAVETTFKSDPLSS